MSVSRVGTDILILWKVLTPNSSLTNLYYTPTGGSETLLTTVPLLAGVKTYTVESQSLSTECISLAGTQIDGGQESDDSLGVPLPTATAIQQILSEPPCGGIPDPPAESVVYAFADSYHHRDHIGNLRVVTDSAGWKVRARDYYPFGMEITPGGAPDTTGGSRMRFTGHERDEETQLDYMLARYYGGGLARFLSVDVVSGELDKPSSWNRYAYAMNSPVILIDPDGLDEIRYGTQTVTVFPGEVLVLALTRSTDAHHTATYRSTGAEGQVFVYDNTYERNSPSTRPEGQSPANEGRTHTAHDIKGSESWNPEEATVLGVVTVEGSDTGVPVWNVDHGASSGEATQMNWNAEADGFKQCTDYTLALATAAGYSLTGVSEGMSTKEFVGAMDATRVSTDAEVILDED